MAGPPPQNLQDWSKKSLIREVQRLRAINREHAERPGTDPRAQSSPGAIVDVAGDPHAQGGAILDMRSAVLMEAVDVALVDSMSGEQDAVAMLMTLGGRINHAADRVEHVYVFGPDGAAGLVSQLIGLAQRASGNEHSAMFAAEFRVDLEQRMKEMP